MNQKYFQTSGEGKVKGKQGKYNTTKNGDKSMKIYNTKYQSAFCTQEHTTTTKTERVPHMEKYNILFLFFLFLFL